MIDFCSESHTEHTLTIHKQKLQPITTPSTARPLKMGPIGRPKNVDHQVTDLRRVRARSSKPPSDHY
jgi:hypothetical protein